MISSARLGDKHVCPLPGHGTTPIASASADFNINFMGSARVGDTCGCGAVITTGFPSILVNGRPMAHFGEPNQSRWDNHRSGDVGGGFVMGAAPGAAIINFAALGAFRADGTDDERMATLLADPNLTEKATAANALIHQDAATKQPEAVPEQITQPNVCNDPDRMEELASYIAGEMNRNINDSSVLKMQKAPQLRHGGRDPKQNGIALVRPTGCDQSSSNRCSKRRGGNGDLDGTCWTGSSLGSQADANPAEVRWSSP